MTPTFFSSNINRLLGSILLVTGILALAAYAALTFREAKITKDMTPSMSVDGMGEVKVTPNVAEFSFSVTTKEKTAETAQSSTSARAADIITMLKAAGVEDKDIKTIDFNIAPHYPEIIYNGNCADEWTPCPPSAELKPDGFDAIQSVTVKVRDLSKAGHLVAEVSKKGASNISGIGFSLDDKIPSQAEARDKAIADAKSKAEKIASQLGLHIKRVTSYYETQNYDQTYAPEMDLAKSAGGSGEPLLPAGEQTVKSSVTVSFEME